MAAPKQPAYRYAATVRRWIDGDSCELDVDLGFGVTKRVEVRLVGIDTPERGQPGYAEATLHAIELAPAGAEVLADSSQGFDKYGRALCVVWALGQDVSVNTRQLDAHHAVPYFGGTRGVPVA